MILDVCFEVPKFKDSILNFQVVFNIRNMELKMSQHIRRTCLWSVTLKVADIVRIWTFTPENNTKSLFPYCKTLHVQCLLGVSYLFIWVYLPIIFLHSFVDLVVASHNKVQSK